NNVEDVCKLGDEIWVKCIGIDEKGRVKLSRRVAMAEREGREVPEKPEHGGGDREGGDRGNRGGDRGDRGSRGGDRGGNRGGDRGGRGGDRGGRGGDRGGRRPHNDRRSREGGDHQPRGD